MSPALLTTSSLVCFKKDWTLNISFALTTIYLLVLVTVYSVFIYNSYLVHDILISFILRPLCVCACVCRTWYLSLRTLEHHKKGPPHMVRRSPEAIKRKTKERNRTERNPLLRAKQLVRCPACYTAPEVPLQYLCTALCTASVLTLSLSCALTYTCAAFCTVLYTTF